MRLKKCLITLLAIISIICLVAFAAGCNGCGGSVNFKQDEYTVRNGDKITAEGSAQYKLLGNVPEGVSVSSDGTFTILSSVENGTQVLLAAYNGDTIHDTAICFISVSQERPELSFLNFTDYLVEGEQVSAKATPAYAVSYSLKNASLGVTVDGVTGRVAYTDKVVDGQSYTVVASSHGATIEKQFYAAISNLSYVENSVAFIETGASKDVSYKINFPDSNVKEQGVLGVTAGKRVAEPDEFSFDGATNSVTINSSFLDKLGQGETVLGIATAKNTAFATVKKATFIGSAEELAAINDNKETVAGYYVLICDIDLTDFLRNKPNGWDAIGTYKDVLDGTALDMAFSGTFDGNGHTISGFFVNKSDVNQTSSFNTGLFGYVTRTGKIKNLNLVAAKDAGYNVCSFAGLLVGVNEGTITNCTTDGSVNSNGASIGSFVGKNLGEIKNCFSLQDSVGEKDVGAFCGKNDGKIIDCYAVGANPFCGDGNATNCVVFATKNQLVEQANFDNWSDWTVYADKLPEIKGIKIDLYLRSLSITNVRTEYIKGYPLKLEISVNPAGLKNLNVNYELINGTGITIDENGEVDLSNAANGSYTIKAFVGNVSCQFTFSVGDTVEDLIVINSVEDFNSFKSNYANFNKEILLMADLDFKGVETTSIGYYYEDADGKNADYSAVFSGIFNGNGHSISNLKINANAYSGTVTDSKYHASFYNVGLFSYVTGTVKDLTLNNVTVEPSYNGEPTGNYVGVVCGTLKGSIQNCALIKCSYYGMGDAEIKSGWFTSTENPNLTGCTVDGVLQ